MPPYIGIISDTHGQLRPEALEALRGSELIIHAGDVGAEDILPRLEAIAPVHAVRGNVDYGDFGATLPPDAVVTWQGKHLYVLHILAEIDLDPAAAGFHAVIYGHSHKPALETKGDVLYLNPGSAGPRRFSLPITVAKISLAEDGSLQATHVSLESTP